MLFSNPPFCKNDFIYTYLQLLLGYYKHHEGRNASVLFSGVFSHLENGLPLISAQKYIDE